MRAVGLHSNRKLQRCARETWAAPALSVKNTSCSPSARSLDNSFANAAACCSSWYLFLHTQHQHNALNLN